MGAFLEKPITNKETLYEEGELDGNKIAYGVSCMQGWRVSMEDTHIHTINVAEKNLGVYGVFDGHGGQKVSEYIESHLLDEIKGLKEFQQITDGKGPDNASLLEQALKTGFLSLDDKMSKLPMVVNKEDHSGSTGVVIAITPTHHVVANCGDSRLIIVGSDGENDAKVEFGTEDHKPKNPVETARIEAAGGTVSFGRVNGDLAVSRAFGDFVYKQNKDLPAIEQQVSPEPELTTIERKPTDAFVCIACDGIWDVMSNEGVAKFIMEKMVEGFAINVICEMLLDRCLDLGSRDNMSAIIVTLPNAPSSVGTLSQEEMDLRRGVRSQSSTSTSSFEEISSPGQTETNQGTSIGSPDALSAGGASYSSSSPSPSAGN